jgi:hypothetical protein
MDVARIEVAGLELDRIVAGVYPPEEIMTRLRRALGVALKARDAGSVSALRSAPSWPSSIRSTAIRSSPTADGSR